MLISRRVFEEAVSVVGTDWAADQLWEKYLEFEASYKELQRITALFKRILAIPLGRLTDMFERLSSFLPSLLTKLGLKLIWLHMSWRKCSLMKTESS